MGGELISSDTRAASRPATAGHGPTLSRMLAGWFALTVAWGCSPHPQPQPLVEQAPAAPSPSPLRDLIARYVDGDGRVDYAGWKAHPADVATLGAYVDALQLASPETAPQRYATEADRIAYWLNLYNGLAVREILRRWPLASIEDVFDPKERYGGFGRGILYDARFKVGNTTMSLLDIETTILRTQYRDARVHFALTCGTRSCPLLPRTPFDASSLEQRLEGATREFINQRANVAVNEHTRQVSLSPIFGWYRQRFEAFVRAHSSHPAPGLLDFIIRFADAELASALVRARDRHFAIIFHPYDWRVNAAGEPAGTEATAEPSIMLDGKEPLADMELTLLDGSSWRASSARGKVLLIDFWATWCRPCLLSFPHYAELEVAYERQGFEVVAIAQDDARGPVEAYADAHHPAITIALDPEHRSAGPPLSIATLPTVLLVDRNGIVRHRHTGYRQPDVSGMRNKIEALLAEEATER